MVVHEAVSVDDEVIALVSSIQVEEESFAIPPGLEYGASGIAPTDDVVEGTGILDSERPCHAFPPEEIGMRKGGRH
jgi:hypothetical protein